MVRSRSKSAPKETLWPRKRAKRSVQKVEIEDSDSESTGDQKKYLFEVDANADSQGSGTNDEVLVRSKSVSKEEMRRGKLAKRYRKKTFEGENMGTDSLSEKYEGEDKSDREVSHRSKKCGSVMTRSKSRKVLKKPLLGRKRPKPSEKDTSEEENLDLSATGEESDDEMTSETTKRRSGLRRKPVRNEEADQKPVTVKRCVCDVCGKNFRCGSELTRHLRTHTGERPHECDECGKTFTQLCNLKIHKLSHTGGHQFTCNTCDRKFTHLPYLKRHLLTHSGTKPHLCRQCGHRFIQRYHLERHLRVHSGDRPYACDKCGKSFPRTDDLRLHQGTVHSVDLPPHSAIPKHPCPTCNKQFIHPGSLAVHQRIHTGEKPYTCQECGKSFCQLSNLNSHMSVHTKLKPHVCSVCGKCFSRNSYLKVHREHKH